jgi:4-amino-4-deoxy-L-arabinose transferase-like glycosyltransferase
MLTTDRTSTVVSGSPSAFWRRSHFSLLELAGLLGTITVAVFLGLFRLSQDGFANSYYAAGVRSMLQNWHNFFFVSFDPGGFVTVDKPPLGYWIQTLSAKILGFHGWSILLPQVLAGAGSVVLLYLLVRRAFGPIAGLLAGLSMALMPVAVADNRNNTVDSLLVFTLLLASWAVLRATDQGRLRWLVLGMALVGAGFNIKMLEAYLALPALLALYAIGAPIAWRKVAGVAGAIAALVAMLGPVSIITYGAAAEWDRLREWRWRPPIEHGIMPVTIGLLLAGTYTLVRLTATDWGGVVITSPPRYCSSADASTQH